jgi:hypothetical protein
MQTNLLLCAIMNSGLAVYMYIARCAVTNFSSNGVQQLKGYFSNNNDSYILAVFGFLFYLCSTPTMFSTKCKIKISYNLQNILTIPNMITNNDINLHFAVFLSEFLLSSYNFDLIYCFAST